MSHHRATAQNFAFSPKKPMCRGSSLRTSWRATVRRSGRFSQGSSIVSVGISITGARTRIGRRANRSIACRGSSQQGMPSASCLRLAPLPNTFALDGLCCPRQRTAKRCGSDSRVGPRWQARSGPP